MLLLPSWQMSEIKYGKSNQDSDTDTTRIYISKHTKPQLIMKIVVFIKID